MSRYRFIEVEKARCAVTTVCRVLQVSRAAYYAWSTATPSTRALADVELLEKIRTIHARSRMTYGAPHVHAELRAGGVCCSRKRVARLMRQNRLASPVSQALSPHHGEQPLHRAARPGAA